MELTPDSAIIIIEVILALAATLAAGVSIGREF